jgi:L,D-peptidoglycan transpeptidase YkuD (ErfK/YbiS/YcfS/YnhG family)
LPSHENLWRHDHVYDIIVVVGYNDQPVTKNKGSAIFMHIVRKSVDQHYQETAGCIAFTKRNLLHVLASLRANTKIIIPIKGKHILIK